MIAVKKLDYTFGVQFWINLGHFDIYEWKSEVILTQTITPFDKSRCQKFWLQI